MNVNVNSDLISVIIPIYNVEKYLAECVESVLNQRYQNLEIILVDDGSTDHCPEMCDEYARTDTRVKVIHKENGGLSDARNAGIDVAEGEYVSFVDSDDYISEDMIGTLYERAMQTQADLTFCGFNSIEEDGTFRRCQEVGDHIFQQNEFWDYKYNKYPVASTVAWTKLYKRNIFESLRFPIGRVHEDLVILPDVIKRCGIIATTSKGKYMYRQRYGSIMRAKYTLANFKIINERIAMVNYFFENNHSNLVGKAMEAVVLELKNGYVNLDFSNLENREAYRKQREHLMEELRKIGRRCFGIKQNLVITILLMLPIDEKVQRIIRKSLGCG